MSDQEYVKNMTEYSCDLKEKEHDMHMEIMERQHKRQMRYMRLKHKMAKQEHELKMKVQAELFKHALLKTKIVIAGFYGICGFRQVIGAIHCTHIRIPKVGGNIGQYYINRKGYSSINVQVVANANLEIMDIVAHWRGSTHDSRIFNYCRLKRRFEQSEFKGRLLGDSGYACSPYLFTPVLNPTTQQEERYNRAHIQTRNTVERCFGVWKQRFRCLLDGFKTKLDNTKLYIVALAILNNIAIHHRDMIENIDQPGNEDIPVIPAINNNIRGNAARAAFINDNF
uniref:Nuclease HARBI1 n=1 Tax=Diabrotica virgifera virgifera TaxID=50390 RepID=A0A6P7GTH2_DIAVI